MNVEKIKVMAFDLDGTLINDKKKVPESTQLYLKELKEKGYILLAITGRILKNTLSIQNICPFLDYAICCGGTLIYDVNTGKSIRGISIDLPTCRMVAHLYEKDFEKISFCTDEYYYNYGYSKRKSTVDKEIDDLESFYKKEKTIYKLEMFFQDKDKQNACIGTLPQNFPDLSFISMQDSFATNRWIEIYPKGVDKVEALNFLLEKLHLCLENVIAFGDGRNDIELLRNVGWGVAMENALEEVKEVACDIAASYMNKGVETYLRQYF